MFVAVEVEVWLPLIWTEKFPPVLRVVEGRSLLDEISSLSCVCSSHSWSLVSHRDESHLNVKGREDGALEGGP